MKITDFKVAVNTIDDYKYNDDELNLNSSFNKDSYKIVDDNGYIAFVPEDNSKYLNIRSVYQYNVGAYSVNGSCKPKYIVPNEFIEYIKANMNLNYYVGKDNFKKIQFGETLAQDSTTLVKPLWLNKKNKTDETFTLPNGSLYDVYLHKNNKYICVENTGGSYTLYVVIPASWYINLETKEMILSKTINSSFPIMRWNNMELIPDIKFEETEFYKYLNIFIKESFRNEKVFNEEKKETNKETSNEIVDKIKEIKNLIKDSENEEVFLDILKEIVEKYNQGLDLYENESTKSLSFGVKNYDYLDNEIKLELDELKNSFLNYNETSREYKDMIIYLDKINCILNGLDVVNKDDLQNLLFDLIRCSLKYLNNNKYNQVLIEELFTKPKELINSHLKSIASNKKSLIPFTSKDELIMYLRAKLHPILESIANDVSKKSLVDDIKENLIQVQKKNILKSKYHIIDLYISLIHEAYNECLPLIDSSETEDLNELNNILNEEIDYNLDIESICNLLINKYHRIKRIYYRESEEDFVLTQVKKRRIKLDSI